MRSRSWRREGAVAAGVLLALVVVILFPSAGVSGTVTSTLTPTADAYVVSTSTSTNFGTSTQLSAGASPTTRAYLKFTVPALGGIVSSATLRLYPNASAATGVDVRSAANNWNEGNITYKNAPTPSATITASSGALTAGTRTSLNVTSLVTSNSTVTFVLTSNASVADLFGSRESANQPQLVVAVNDTTAPAVTLSAPAKGSTLTTSLPTYSGKAGTAPNDSASVTVNVYAGSLATGTPVQTLSATAQSANWSVAATTPLPNGTYTAQASQQDSAGNTGLSGANTFRITDSTAPTVTLTQPGNGSTLGTATPSFVGVAGSAAGDSPTVTVRVYSGPTATGTPVQTLTATSQADHSYSVAAAPLATGTYTARAQQVDAAGNTGSSSANTFTVDTNAPAVTLTQPANGSLVTTATPSFAGQAGNAAGDSATVTVKVYPGTTASGTPAQTLTATRQSDNSYTVTAAALADGTYTAQATQPDGSGNTGSSGANTFMVDTAAPTVALAQPANGAALTSGTVTYAGTAGSATGDSATVTVKIYSGSTVSGTPVQTLTATRRADSSYTATALSSLPEGTYTARSEQQDAAGHTGVSSANTFTIALPDTTAPTVTLTQPPNGAILSAATPSFLGVAGTAAGDSATVTVKVYSGGTATGTPVQTLTATAQGDASYAVTASTLADGTYTAQAQQSDVAGNIGFSSSNTFRVDTTAPSVTLTQPANGSSMSTPAPSFAGTAGNATGDSATVTVDVYAGTAASGTPVQSLTAARQPDNSWTANGSVLADGTYTVQASQADSAGSRGLSPASTFTVDSASPIVTLTQPANGSVGSNSSPTFAGSAGALAGDGTLVVVNVYTGTSVAGAPVETLNATRQGDNTYSVAAAAPLADGTYTAQAMQQDAAGNLGFSAAGTFTIDTAAPAVTLTQPADGTTVSTATPNFGGSAGNAPGDGASVTVKVYAGTSVTGAPVQTLGASRGSGNGYSATASSLAEGTYTAQAEQQDAAGNTGRSSTSTFTISLPDTTRPAVTLTSPADGASLSTSTPTFSGKAGSATGDSASVTVKVYAGSGTGGSLVQTLTATPEVDSTYSATATTPLAEGTYTAQAEQDDAAGNTGRSSANTFTVALPDTTPPAVTLTTPADGSTVTTALPAFGGAAGNAPGDSATVTVKVYAGPGTVGTPVQTLTATRQDTSYSVIATASLAEGTYTAQAEQGDAAGNTGRSSANTFTVALPDGTPPTVTLTAPADGASVSTATPTFSGKAGTASGDSASVTVKVYAGSGTGGTPVQTLTATRQGDNSYSIAAASLAEGTYTAQAEQQDATGNIGLSSANTFTVSLADTTPPTVTLTTPADGSTVTTALPVFGGAAGNAPGDAATVTVKVFAGSGIGGTLVQTLTASRQGDNSYSVAAAAPLAEGTYTAQAEQSDAAGNTAHSSANTFTVATPDGTPPTVTLTQPANGATVGTAIPSLAGVAGSAAGDSSTVTVKLYAGSADTGSPLQTLTASRQGDNSYSATAATLTDGTYTARAEQSDSAGNTGTSAPTTFTVDTTAPAPTLTQPTAGGTVATATPTFSGVAGAAPGDAANVTVSVYAGSSPTGSPVQVLSTTRQADGTYTITATSSLIDGLYTAQATQDDSAGNSGSSPATTFAVDTVAPSPTLTQPADGSTVPTALPTFSGVAGTAAGDQGVLEVDVYPGTTATGTPVQALSASRNGDNSYTVTAGTSLPEGTYTAQTKQQDAAGHVGFSAPSTFTISLPDATAPVVTLTQPANGATLGTSSPSFSGVAGSAAGDSPTVTVDVYAGSGVSGTPVQTLTAARQGDDSYAAAASSLADGTYTARAEQQDTSGNTGFSAPSTFTVDTTGPSPTLTQPAAGSTVSSATPTFSGTAGSANGDASTVTVSVYAGTLTTGTPVETLVAARLGDNTFTATATSPLADGTYTARADQSDAAGNTGSSPERTFVVDTLAPSVTLTQPANGATAATALPTYSGVAGSEAGDGASVEIDVYAGPSASGTPVQTLTATRQVDSGYSTTATVPLAEGTYTARAKQQDGAGHTGLSAANTFTISLPDTTPPTVTLTAPADGSTVATATPSFTGVAGSASGDSSTVTVKVYAGPTATGSPVQTLAATRQADNSYSVTASPALAEGTYTARAEQSDTAGNTGSSSTATFTVALPDTTPPTVTLTQPANGAVVTNPAPTFSGVAGNAANDSSTVTVKLYAGAGTSGTPLQTLAATRGADNTYSVTASSHLAAGTYTARAEQKDAAGNLGLSAATTFTIRLTVVSLTFNDGNASQYTYARPVLQAHSMNGTFYVPSGWISNLGGYMSWNQVDTLYRDGNEIGGMDTDHVSLTTVYNSDWTQDFAYKKQEVCGDHDRLAEQGYDPQSFAYPAAAVNYTFADGSTVKQLVRSCGYLSGRTVGGLSNTGPAFSEPVPPADAFALRTLGMPSGAVTLATLENAVTAAANQGGGWVPIAFNNFCHQGAANYSACIGSGNQPIDDAVFSQFLDWLQHAGQPGGAPAGVDVRTVRQVMGAPPQPTLPPRPTVVSLTFNDGIANQYTYARPVLQAHNMNGTFYVASGWISNLGGYMSWGQLDNLYRDGDEIGGMSTDHVNLTQVFNSDWTQDFAYKKQEVCGDHDRLVEMGYDPRSFAYPASASSYTFADGSTVEQLVKSCGYLSGRKVGGLSTTGTTAELVPPVDPFATRTAGMPSGAVTLATLQSAVTAAATQGGGWVPIAFNNFCHQGAANYSACISSGNQPIDDAVFSQFLDWLQNAGRPGGAPAGVQVQTVRKTMGAPAQPVLPPRQTTVSLTFDDGDATQYQVRSMLSSHGMHGTFFINSGKVGSDSTYMTWPQINDIYSDGNEIGGHTVQHVNLTQVDANEATREVCNDRSQLIGHGFQVTDLAYPFGATNASVEAIVQGCGYNSARTTATMTGGCPPTCAEPIPPRDPYATRIISVGTESLATLEQRVTNAEQNGGGWVQMLFHNVCNGCSADATSPATLSAFLDWLQPRAASGTVVRTVQQVIGGPVQPAVAGPPLPPAVGATNGIVNSSLEADANTDGVPDCFNLESWGPQTWSWTRTNDAHSGSFAERVDVTNYTDGANKVNIFQDMGFCTPTVTPNHRYTISTWYKSTAPVDFVIETRDSTGEFTFFAETQTFPASPTTWSLATLTTQRIPNGANGLTFGLSLAANGSMTVDDVGIVDANP